MEGGSTPKRAKVEVIDLSSLEEDEDDAATRATTTGSANGAVARRSNSDDFDDEEVQVMDPPPPPSFLAAHSEEENDPSYEDDDDDADNEEEIHLLGTKNAQNLPHRRPHCTQCPYVAQVLGVVEDEHSEPRSSSTASNTKTSNASYCSRCYCYVCDVPVSECQEWGTHCHATDRSTYWMAQRRTKQGRTMTTAATSTIFLRSTSPLLQATLRNASAFLGGLRAVCNLRLPSFTLVCSETGIQVVDMDDATVSLTVLSLPASGFTKYVCTPGGGSHNRLQLTLDGSDIAHLKKYLKGARKTDDLVFQIKEAGGCLEVWREHATKDVPDHPIRLRVVHNDPAYAPLYVPHTVYPCTVAMDSARFQAMIEFLQSTGCEEIKVTWRQGNPPKTTVDAGDGDDEPKVIFSSIAPCTLGMGFRGANFYYFNGQQLGFTHQSTVVRCENSAEAKYTTRYLALFAKAAPMSSRVLLSFSVDMPCAVEYRVPDWSKEGGNDAETSSNAVSAGSLTFYLGPRNTLEEALAS